jgi:pimeloyl-ACP methyl ester carboxylesterase
MTTQGDPERIERSTFVLIPGAGGAAWYWHLVAAELVQRGHDALAVELPADDESAGLRSYADAVLAAAGDRRDAVLVAQSMGAFTAPLVAEPLGAARIVLVNAMIPMPGETPGAWWANVGSEAARLAAAARGGWSPEFDLETYFLHDVPAALAAEGEPHQKQQADAPFGDRCEFSQWPAPVTVVAGRDDRFFPLELQQRLARERVGVDAVVVPGGHLAALSHPVELTDAILNAAH